MGGASLCLWISSGETPSDQDFFRKYDPQDYHHSQVLSSGANQARGLAVMVEGSPVLSGHVGFNTERGRLSALSCNMRRKRRG